MHIEILDVGERKEVVGSREDVFQLCYHWGLALSLAPPPPCVILPQHTNTLRYFC